MSRRSGWLWLLVFFPACVTYQLVVHSVIANDDTSAVRLGVAIAAGLAHAAINLTLLWVFGRTLVKGRVPLITGFAKKIHGTLPPALELYTRRVTAAWCVFFVAQVVVSAALSAWSLATWSVFVNMLSFPSIVLMFVVEYLYRISRHRNFPHASILDGVRAFSDNARNAASARERRSSHG